MMFIVLGRVKSQKSYFAELSTALPHYIIVLKIYKYFTLINLADFYIYIRYSITI